MVSVTDAWFLFLHFFVSGKVNYTVYVDRWRRLVWDNGGCFVVDLNVDSLRLCTVIISKDLGVSTLQMVV